MLLTVFLVGCSTIQGQEQQPTSTVGASTESTIVFVDRILASEALARGGSEWVTVPASDFKEMLQTAIPMPSDPWIVEMVAAPGVKERLAYDTVIASASIVETWLDTGISSDVALGGSTDIRFEDSWLLNFAAVLSNASTVELVGADIYLTAAVSSRQLATFDQLVALATDPLQNSAWTDDLVSPSEDSWEDLDPSVRILDVEETPADVLRSLDLIEVLVDIPSGWIDISEVAVCTKVPELGLNECAALESTGDPTISMLAYVDSTRNLDLYFMNFETGELLGEIGSTSVSESADSWHIAIDGDLSALEASAFSDTTVTLRQVSP